MDIRDINKTIEMNKLKKSKRKCKIIGLVWFGTSAITAGILAPILLAQPNNNTNTETGTPGTGTPTNNLKTGYVYGGHIYDSEDGAKTALLATKTGNKPAITQGSLLYSIDGIKNPLETTDSNAALKFRHEFTSTTTPTTDSLYNEVNPVVDPASKVIVRSGEQETVVSFHNNAANLTKIKNLLSMTEEPFIRYSLTPSNDPSDYKDSITNLHLGKYTNDFGYLFSPEKTNTWDKSYYDSSDTVNPWKWVDGDLPVLNFDADAASATPYGLKNSSSGPKALILNKERRLSAPGHSIATAALRFKAAIDMGGGNWTTMSHAAPVTGPTIFIYTNLTKAAWETDLEAPADPTDQSKKLHYNFMVLSHKPGDAVGTPGTEVAALYEVKSGNKILGQIRVDSSGGNPGAIPTFDKNDVHIDNATMVVPSPERPWEISDLTATELANITVVPDVEFTNGEVWPKP